MKRILNFTLNFIFLIFVECTLNITNPENETNITLKQSVVAETTTKTNVDFRNVTFRTRERESQNKESHVSNRKAITRRQSKERHDKPVLIKEDSKIKNQDDRKKLISQVKVKQGSSKIKETFIELDEEGDTVRISDAVYVKQSTVQHSKHNESQRRESKSDRKTNRLESKSDSARKDTKINTKKDLKFTAEKLKGRKSENDKLHSSDAFHDFQRVVKKLTSYESERQPQRFEIIKNLKDPSTEQKHKYQNKHQSSKEHTNQEKPWRSQGHEHKKVTIRDFEAREALEKLEDSEYKKDSLTSRDYKNREIPTKLQAKKTQNDSERNREYDREDKKEDKFQKHVKPDYKVQYEFKKPKLELKTSQEQKTEKEILLEKNIKQHKTFQDESHGKSSEPKNNLNHKKPYVYVGEHSKPIRLNYEKPQEIKSITMDWLQESEYKFNIPEEDDVQIDKDLFELDPVLNTVHIDRRNNLKPQNSSESSDITIEKSSSLEMGHFKDEFKKLLLQKKYEAVQNGAPAGDEVNIQAARPWGTKCGDPAQHDMPWGTCMLAIECEPEYRIFRGDFLCGKTALVCCGLELNTYDLYGGFDASFDGSKGLSTESEEINRQKDQKAKEKSDRKERKNRRKQRKRRIKKVIRNIIREIQKIMNKLYSNATKARKKKTKQLSNFVEFLKKEYKKNRQAMKDIHGEHMIKIDKELMQKLHDIARLNKRFMSNSTFSQVLLNGTMTKSAAVQLVQAYPELEEFVINSGKNKEKDDHDNRKHILSEKDAEDGGSEKDVKVERRTDNKKPDYLEYDVEYGFLYY